MPHRLVGVIDLLRRTAVLVSLAGLALGTAACGGSSQGTDTRCSLDGCTVTFSRGVDAQASVLGINAELVRVGNNQATIEVAGQQVVVPVGGESQAEGFNVALQEITQEDVTVRITTGGGGGGEGGGDGGGGGEGEAGEGGG